METQFEKKELEKKRKTVATVRGLIIHFKGIASKCYFVCVCVLCISWSVINEAG